LILYFQDENSCNLGCEIIELDKFMILLYHLSSNEANDNRPEILPVSIYSKHPDEIIKQI